MGSPQPKPSDAPFYGDYIDFLRRQNDFEWLLNFMTRDHTKDFKTRVVVADCSDENLTMQSATDSDHALQLLRQSKAKPSKGEWTRLVLLCYEETWSFDRTVLKAVAEQYALPPTFLSSHFYHDQSWADRDLPPDIERRYEIGGENDTPYLRSERRNWIELRTGFSTDCFSALVQYNNHTGHLNTHVIFIRTKELALGQFRIFRKADNNAVMLARAESTVKVHPTMAACYEALLQNLSPHELDLASSCPVEYILPYVHLLAFEFSRLIKWLDERLDKAKHDLNAETHREIWQDSIKLQGELESCMSMVRRHSSSSWKYSDVLKDFGELLESAKQKQNEFRDTMSFKVSLLALEESKESIKQTRAVTRLTQLAFIFIPLTFVTSCFGMNLTVLDSGTGELWTFSVTALSMTTLVLLVSAYGWRISEDASKRLKRPKRQTRILVRLTQYLPFDVLWMVLFWVSHPFQLGYFLDSMGLYFKLLPEGPDDFTPRNKYQPSSHLNLSEFWHRKGQRIHQFFMEEGWRQNTFIHRIMQRKSRKSESVAA